MLIMEEMNYEMGYADGSGGAKLKVEIFADGSGRRWIHGRWNANVGF